MIETYFWCANGMNNGTIETIKMDYGYDYDHKSHQMFNREIGNNWYGYDEP